MKRTLLILALSLVVSAGDLRATDIYTLIKKGQLKEASDSLSVQSSAALRDGRLLFFQGLLEEDAGESARLMEAALGASVPARYQEEIYYRLAQYYLIKPDYAQLSRLVNEYRARWETGRYQGEMMRFSVLVDQLSGDYESALRQVDRYLLQYTTGEEAQRGEIDKARVLGAHKKSVGATKILRSLARGKSGGGVPQALYLMALDAAAKNRIDDAVFYYNLLREGYPNAIGLDHLVNRLGGMSQETSHDRRAEEITGTYYSVQVGVFSIKSNAKKHAELFKVYERKIDIKTKTISGRKYRVVYVGRFDTFEEARRFKTQLESTHGEVYQVVAR